MVYPLRKTKPFRGNHCRSAIQILGGLRKDIRNKVKTLTACVDQALKGGNVRIRPPNLPLELPLHFPLHQSREAWGYAKGPLTPDLNAFLGF